MSHVVNLQASRVGLKIFGGYSNDDLEKEVVEWITANTALQIRSISHRFAATACSSITSIVIVYERTNP